MRTNIRPAATLVVLRDGHDGPEVLLMQRRLGGSFSGYYVFPGGTVDANDFTDLPCTLSPTTAAAAEFDSVAAIKAHCVAVIRETFEEAGFLLARDQHGRDLSLDKNFTQHELAALRAGQLSFSDYIRQNQITLNGQYLDYFARWVTPPISPKRWDTRFFVTTVRHAPRIDYCPDEMQGFQWLRPQAALSDRRIKLVSPTRNTLQQISQAASAADAHELLTR